MAELLSHSNDLWEVMPVPNASETLCSLVLHLPVESFRTKHLPTLHMQHASKKKKKEKETSTITQTARLLAYFSSKHVLSWTAFTNSIPAGWPCYRLHCSHPRYKTKKLQDRSSQSKMKDVEKL